MLAVIKTGHSELVLNASYWLMVLSGKSTVCDLVAQVSFMRAATSHVMHMPAT